MKKFLKNTSLLQIAISIALIVSSLSVAYYFVYYLPSKERSEKVSETEQAQSKANIYSDCDAEAEETALQLLEQKVEILEETNQTHSQEYQLWKQAVEKGLYLKEDYNSYYDKCVNRYGL